MVSFHIVLARIGKLMSPIYYKYKQHIEIYPCTVAKSLSICYKNDIKNTLGFQASLGGQIFSYKAKFDLYKKEWVL